MYTHTVPTYTYTYQYQGNGNRHYDPQARAQCISQACVVIQAKDRTIDIAGSKGTTEYCEPQEKGLQSVPRGS